MKLRSAAVSVATLGLLAGTFVGCGGPPEGDIKPSRPMTKEESDASAKKMIDGMNGQYKGAPNRPFKPPVTK